MGHRIAAHGAAEDQQDGGQNGGLHHGEGDPEHNLPLGRIQNGGRLLQIGVHIPENTADEDIGEGGVMQPQHHNTGEHPQAPPGGHLNAQGGGQQAVGGAGDRVGVEHMLPHHGQRPLGHDIGENKNRAEILAPGHVRPRHKEGEQPAEQDGHHAGAHRHQQRIQQRGPQVGLCQPAGKQIDVVHQGIAGHLAGQVGVNGAGVYFNGILHNGHNGGHRGDGQHNAHQQ